jgi:hypothetical protein
MTGERAVAPADAAHSDVRGVRLPPLRVQGEQLSAWAGVAASAAARLVTSASVVSASAVLSSSASVALAWAEARLAVRWCALGRGW